MVERSVVSRGSDGWGGAKMDDLVQHMGYFFKAEKLFCMALKWSIPIIHLSKLRVCNISSVKN